MSRSYYFMFTYRCFIVLYSIGVMKSSHPSLVPDIRRKTFNLLPLSLMWPVGLAYMAHILRHVPSIFHSLRVYITTGCCTLSNAFSASVQMSTWFLSFVLLVWHCVYWLLDVEPFLHCRYKSHLILAYDPVNALLNFIARILLRTFASIFIRVIGL